MKKIINFINSWKYFPLEKKNNVALVGYEGEDLLNYFKHEKVEHFCTKKKRPFNISVIPFAIILFLKTLILKPKLFFKSFRLSHSIYLIGAFIKKKNINTLLSFTDYNEINLYIKKILEDKINLISIQNSRRDNRINHFQYDQSLILYPLNDKEKKLINKKNIVPFGSLRLLLEIGKNSYWEKFEKNEEEKKIKSIVLISSLSPEFLDFFYNEIGFEKKLDEELIFDYIDYYTNKVKNLRKLRFLNFVLLLLYTLESSKKFKIPIQIINRMEEKNKTYFKREISFFNYFDKNIKVFNFSKNEKYNFIINSKEKIFVSDISTLSRECLSLKLRCYFFYPYVKYVEESWFDENSIFFNKNKNKNQFIDTFEKIINMSQIDFNNNFKNLKITTYAYPPDRDKIKYFLKLTNLEMKNEI
tara:strand:+ start:285 stop:1529 length:1245 start_codon:yes stop_codon:yes gene_type:complete